MIKRYNPAIRTDIVDYDGSKTEVAFMKEDENGSWIQFVSSDRNLSEAEIIEIRRKTSPLTNRPWADTIAFARAILKAQEEKNGH